MWRKNTQKEGLAVALVKGKKRKNVWDIKGNPRRFSEFERDSKKHRVTFYVLIQGGVWK